MCSRYELNEAINLADKGKTTFMQFVKKYFLIYQIREKFIIKIF